MPKKEDVQPTNLDNKYKPQDGDNVARVFITNNSVTAYKQPVVDTPVNPYADSKTYGKSDYPAQSGTKLPDPFPELPDKARSYLKLFPYGENIIINKKYISRLMSFYMKIKDTPLPQSVQTDFTEHMRMLRELLNLCTIEDSDARWDEIIKDNKPTFPKYICKCEKKK